MKSHVPAPSKYGMVGINSFKTRTYRKTQRQQESEEESEDDFQIKPSETNTYHEELRTDEIQQTEYDQYGAESFNKLASTQFASTKSHPLNLHQLKSPTLNLH